MELGRCPACATPYSAADLVGLGILRARPAVAGGPLLEYRCGSCARVLTLVPHGDGRYAPPGEPPPPAVPVEERRPHWVREAPRGAPRAAAATAAPPEDVGAPPTSAPPPSAAREAKAAAPRLGALEACELLGVSVTAPKEELERAFRSRSLTCHPDKVAHLDAEFQALADRKFKRLMEAYQLLSELASS